MTDQADKLTDTRMLFIGDSALTDGFQLIGFETWPDPTAKQLERLLEELVDSKQNAFIILDSKLSESGSPMLQRIRAEGGRIVIAEVPPLNDPECFNCGIDNKLQTLMGGDLTRGS